MFNSVLIPLDGSAQSARAVPFAKCLAQAARARLIVVRAHLPGDDLSLRLEYPDQSLAKRSELERHMAETEFQSTLDGLRNAGLDVESHFIEGVAGTVIYETAKAARANLIVMSTHGLGGLGRWLYGSVADEVLRRVPVPVLLVSAVCTQTWAKEQRPPVVVPLDGSSLAAGVLGPARDLALLLGGELLLLAVVEPVAVYPYAHSESVCDIDDARATQAARWLVEAAADLRGLASPPISTRVAYGNAAEEICAVAREVGAGAIAMATHGRSGLARLVLGSVATRTLQQSSVPLLVYRPLAVQQTSLERALERVAETSPNDIGDVTHR